MIFLDFVILVIVLGIALLFTTQVFMPMLFGTPFFPLFRKSTPLKDVVDKMERTLEEETEFVFLTEKISKLNARKAELERKKNGNS